MPRVESNQIIRSVSPCLPDSESASLGKGSPAGKWKWGAVGGRWQLLWRQPPCWGKWTSDTGGTRTMPSRCSRIGLTGLACGLSPFTLPSTLLPSPYASRMPSSLRLALLFSSDSSLASSASSRPKCSELPSPSGLAGDPFTLFLLLCSNLCIFYLCMNWSGSSSPAF